MNNQRMLEILEEIYPHIDPWEFPVGLTEKIHALIEELKKVEFERKGKQK